MLFAVIGWSDYLDGIAARVTGQYSRLGALLDPLVDRLLVLAGVIVCWHFELLPRWALALLAARELFMLVLARYAMHRRRRPEDQLAGAAGASGRSSARCSSPSAECTGWPWRACMWGSC